MKPCKACVTLLGLASIALAQASGARGIQPEGIVLARPPAKSPKATKPAPPRYHSASTYPGASFRDPAGSQVRQVGITIWRLRPAVATDVGARILVHEESASAEWIPERLDSTAALVAGDRVRLSIESPDAGYLYVIDREQYNDGTRGEPYLIFPTARTNAGDNHLSAGRLAEIPAQTDRPNYFSLRRSRPNQTLEELTVLLTPEPISGLTLGPTALRLTNEQVADWEKQWGGKTVQRFELSGGAGRPWTRAEQEVGANTSRLLTQEDAPPQTVYRAIGSNSSDPLMVKVSLRYR